MNVSVDCGVDKMEKFLDMVQKVNFFWSQISD